MLSSQEEQREREEVMRQDADFRRQQREQAQREQSSTFHQHAQSEANVDLGRFGTLGNPTVVGAEPAVKYPQLPSSSPWSGAQPEPGIEPPLGFENSALEPSTSHACVEATSPASADAPSLSDLASLGDAQRAGAGPFSSQTETRLGGPAAVSFASRPDTFIPNVNAGSPSNKDDDNG